MNDEQARMIRKLCAIRQPVPCDQFVYEHDIAGNRELNPRASVDMGDMKQMSKRW